MELRRDKYRRLENDRKTRKKVEIEGKKLSSGLRTKTHRGFIYSE